MEENQIEKVYKIIWENPGISISEILEKFNDYGASNIYSYLRSLHAGGFIEKKFEEDSKEVKFYPVVIK